MTNRVAHQNRIFKLHAFAMAFALSAGMVAAQSSPSKNDCSIYAELAKAPKKDAARRNPLAKRSRRRCGWRKTLRSTLCRVPW